MGDTTPDEQDSSAVEIARLQAECAEIRYWADLWEKRARAARERVAELEAEGEKDRTLSIEGWARFGADARRVRTTEFTDG